jgi:SAP domain-containing ribonucleoprotein
MVEYSKLKNAELEALLKERGLPHTGKKADMVTRLEEDDKKKSEDEIDWDDDGAEVAKPVPVEAAPVTAEATNTSVDGNNPQAVPNQAAAIDPSATADLAVKQPEEGATETANGAEEAKEPEEPKIDYTSGIAATDIDKELEARKRRAERFNIKPDDQDPAAAEAQKRLERSKKFGDEAPDANKIDSALTERRKRGREGGDDRGDFKRGRGRGRFRGGPRRGGGGFRGDHGPREERSGGGNRESWMNADDRAAAEKRKARFG